MKIDIFYLSLPDKSYRDDKIFTDENINNFERVNGGLVTLEKRIYDYGNTVYLYAFTDNKNLADRYEETHDMNIFKRVRKKLNKKEYESFRKEHLGALIIEYDISNDSNALIDDLLKPKLLCTKNEVYEITDSLIMYADEMISDICTVDYHIFEEKYYECLDLLFYCTFFGLNTVDSDVVNYNLSYGSTAEGYNKTSMSYGYNLGMLYVRLFALLLRKDV